MGKIRHPETGKANKKECGKLLPVLCYLQTQRRGKNQERQPGTWDETTWGGGEKCREWWGGFKKCYSRRTGAPGSRRPRQWDIKRRLLSPGCEGTGDRNAILTLPKFSGQHPEGRGCRLHGRLLRTFWVNTLQMVWRKSHRRESEKKIILLFGYPIPCL